MDIQDVQSDAVLEAMMPGKSPGSSAIVAVSGALFPSGKTEKCGYPLKIMDSIPDEKFCCSFCTLLLREPMQNSCGHRFCRGCVEIIQNSPPPVYCQSCKDEDDECVLNVNEMFDDKAARREMRKLPVRCVYPGCSWKGTFNDFIGHDENCEKRMVLCSQCNVNVSKAKLDAHKTKSCRKRNVPCQYCNEMIVCDNTENHHKTCLKYVIKCEECSEKLERQDLTEHQEKTCASRVITCPVPKCNVRLPLSQFLSHIGKENLKNEHMAFLLEKVSTLDNQVVQLEARTSRPTQPIAGGPVIATPLSMPEQVAAELDTAQISSDEDAEAERSAGDGAQADTSLQSEDRQKLKLHEDLMSVLHSEILRCINKGEALGRGMEKEEKRVRDLYAQFETLLAKYTDLDRKYTEVERQIKLSPDTGELSSEGNGIFTWLLPSFSEVRRNACTNVRTSVSSPCFFSQPSGYKMKLTLFPDGRGPSKGKCLSLFLEFVAGPFDDLLVWPFTGRVHFMLVDQKDFRLHFVKCYQVANPIQRPTAAESEALGMEDFIHKEQFAKSLDKYIMADKIYIKTCIELSANVKERIALLDPRRAASVK